MKLYQLHFRKKLTAVLESDRREQDRNRAVMELFQSLEEEDDDLQQCENSKESEGEERGGWIPDLP